MNVPFTERRLYRSSTDSYLGGVLGGIAQTYGWDSSLVRLLFLACFLVPGPQPFLPVLYIIAWMLVPMDESQTF